MYYLLNLEGGLHCRFLLRNTLTTNAIFLKV
jgi:hypothetical protein